jgi:hypothetical protein
MSTLKDVGISLISGAISSALTFFWPKVWRLYEARYVDPKTALLKFMAEKASWYQDRAERLAAFSFELGRAPDAFKLEVLISKLDRQDREWAMKEKDIATLRRCADAKAEECRTNLEDASRWAEHVGDQTFFPL